MTLPITVPPPEPSWVTIGFQNQSENGHQVFLFHIDSGRPAAPFCFEESVGGGHMSGGGAVALCLERLDSWIGNWRDHLEKSGCGWVIEVIVALRNEGSASVVEAILEGHRVLEHLKALQLPGDFFSLHETKDEALCLLCENRRWVIFYSERGTRSGLQAYESAAEAHAAFLESIQKMTGIS